MTTIEELWAALEEAADDALDGDARGVPIAARALALASFQAGWKAGCCWDDDPDAENSEVDMDALLLGEERISAL